VSAQAASETFLAFFGHIALGAERFRSVHDDALAALRTERGLRSKTHPFPDLQAEADLVELPFWHLDGTDRAPLWMRPGRDGGDLLARGVRVGTVEETRRAPRTAIEGAMAPRAVTLTLFNRLFVADLFVHGAGGSGYDTVTDRVSRSFFGIEAPPFAAATMTLRLPVDAGPSQDEAIVLLRQRVHEMEHNPDRVLRTQRSSDPSTVDLIERKASLVARIALPDADKKTLGLQIREINGALAEALGPAREEAVRRIEALEGQRETRAVLMDRTYPVFLFDPEETASILRRAMHP
jgi:hypothetical protein